MFVQPAAKVISFPYFVHCFGISSYDAFSSAAEDIYFRTDCTYTLWADRGVESVTLYIPMYH